MSLFTRRFRRRVLVVGMNLAVQVASAEAGFLMRGPLPPPALHEEAARSATEGRPPHSSPGEPASADEGPRWKNRVRRRLQSASTGLGLARLQLRAGLTQDAQATLDALHEEIQSLRKQLHGPGEHAVPPAPRGRCQASRRKHDPDDRGLLAGCTE